MPRFPHVLWGIVMLTCACANPAAGVVQQLVPAEPMPSAAPSSAPSAPSILGAGNAPWALELEFSGDLTGAVAGTAPTEGALRNECTGKNSARGGRWASTLLLTVGPERVGQVILVEGYKGAGTFVGGISVEVHTLDVARVWNNRPDDPVSFTVFPDEESGKLEATLSNAAAPTQKLRVKGRWSCRT